MNNLDINDPELNNNTIPDLDSNINQLVSTEELRFNSFDDSNQYKNSKPKKSKVKEDRKVNINIIRISGSSGNNKKKKNLDKKIKKNGYARLTYPIHYSRQNRTMSSYRSKSRVEDMLDLLKSNNRKYKRIRKEIKPAFSTQNGNFINLSTTTNLKTKAKSQKKSVSYQNDYITEYNEYLSDLENTNSSQTRLTKENGFIGLPNLNNS